MSIERDESCVVYQYIEYGNDHQTTKIIHPVVHRIL